jgi:hypothetical protein
MHAANNKKGCLDRIHGERTVLMSIETMQRSKLHGIFYTGLNNEVCICIHANKITLDDNKRRTVRHVPWWITFDSSELSWLINNNQHYMDNCPQKIHVSSKYSKITSWDFLLRFRIRLLFVLTTGSGKGFKYVSSTSTKAYGIKYRITFFYSNTPLFVYKNSQKFDIFQVTEAYC